MEPWNHSGDSVIENVGKCQTDYVVEILIPRLWVRLPKVFIGFDDWFRSKVNGFGKKHQKGSEEWGLLTSLKDVVNQTQKLY